MSKEEIEKTVDGLVEQEPDDDSEEAQERQEVVDRLQAIRIKIEELTREARDLLESYGSDITFSRAESYWIPHIIGALTKESEWRGGSMITMEDSIAELEGKDG